MSTSHTFFFDAYYLATDEHGVFCSGFGKAGQIVTSGQPSLELYPTFDLLNAALVAHGQPKLTSDPVSSVPTISTAPVVF